MNNPEFLFQVIQHIWYSGWDNSIITKQMWLHIFLVMVIKYHIFKILIMNIRLFNYNIQKSFIYASLTTHTNDTLIQLCSSF